MKAIHYLITCFILTGFGSSTASYCQANRCSDLPNDTSKNWKIITVDSCNFENPGEIVINIPEYAGNLWQIGIPSKQYLDTAYSLPNAIITDRYQVYKINNHSQFDVVIPGFHNGNQEIRFKHKYETDTLKDGGYIEASFDNGITWNNILDKLDDYGFCTKNFYSDNDTLYNGENGFSGHSQGWILTRIITQLIIPCKSHYTDTLILRFNFISDSVQNEKDGWMIDDIKLNDLHPLFGFINNPSGNKVTVYPNPFTNKFYLSLNGYSGYRDIKILVTDLIGRKYLETEYDRVENPIAIEAGKYLISEGLYLLTVISKESRISIPVFRRGE